MAKQLSKEGGRKWYTATISPHEKRKEQWHSRSHEVLASDEQAVKDYLKRKGWIWGRITITEGKNIPDVPKNKDAWAERYHDELEAMLGHHLPPRSNTGPFRIGYNATPEVQDVDARKSWATYLKEWSYGLSVSALPHNLEADICGTIYLPARWVQDPKEWHQCTAIVQATVKQWRASGTHTAEHLKGDRSPKGRQFLKDALEAVKSSVILESWTFPAFMESFLPGYSTSLFDIPNPRLFNIATGFMLPTSQPDRDYVKVEFWRHLLAAWDGPANSRAEVVRSMLDHHHLHGERADVLRALVKSTATRLRTMQGTRRPRPEHWMALADELEQWIADARKAPNSAKSKNKPRTSGTQPTIAKNLDGVPGAAKLFLELVEGAGLVDGSRNWIASNKAKGKGKLIAAWDAVVEVLKVPGFNSDVALVHALKNYFDGLEYLDRLDKVRKRPSYTDHLEKYTADLFGK